MMPVTCFDKGCPRSGNFKIMFSVGFAYEASPGDENDTYWENGNDRRRCTRVKREAAWLDDGSLIRRVTTHSSVLNFGAAQALRAIVW
jgi:hypothetical protein